MCADVSMPFGYVLWNEFYAVACNSSGDEGYQTDDVVERMHFVLVAAEATNFVVDRWWYRL